MPLEVSCDRRFILIRLLRGERGNVGLRHLSIAPFAQELYKRDHFGSCICKGVFYTGWYFAIDLSLYQLTFFKLAESLGQHFWCDIYHAAV